MGHCLFFLTIKLIFNVIGHRGLINTQNELLFFAISEALSGQTLSNKSSFRNLVLYLEAVFLYTYTMVAHHLNVSDP